MDTSEQYIKMCDCPEIQGKRSKEGLEVACWVTRYLYISKSFDYWTMVKAPHVWLSTQDQIQEMMPPHDHPSTIAVYFGLFCDNKEMFEGIYAKKGYGFVDKFKSMEQLWLAFYMHEKHGKIWNGDKWLKKQ